MGRKSKDKSLLGSASRRRTVLQIEPVSRRKEAEAPQSGIREINPTSISAIGLLGQYADNSDDEEQKSQSADENNPVVPPSATTTNDQPSQANKVQIDSKLVDFFKEIEAISTEDTTPAESADIEDVTSGASDANKQQQEDTQFDAYSSSEATYTVSPPWQEVCDPSTNYIYYWNTLTNEVSWEIPRITIPDVPALEQLDEASDAPLLSTPTVPDETCIPTRETADELPAPIERPRSPVEPEAVVSLGGEMQRRTLDAGDESGSSSPHDSQQADPADVLEPDTGPLVPEPDGSGARDSPVYDSESKPKKRLVNPVIDMFESEAQGSEPDNASTQGEFIPVQPSVEKLEKYDAEEMLPEYPPSPENVSNPSQNSPDVERDIGEEFVVVDDWHDEGRGEECGETLGEDESRSKKASGNDEEDALETPSKKARYDSDGEQGSEEEFAEKLLEEFLEGKSRDVEDSADDMEVESDSEGKETSEDDNRPLLPPEAFQPNNAGEEAAKQETDTATALQSHVIMDKSKDEEEEKLTTEIFDLSALLTSKLDFLNITKDGLNKLQLVLLQMETRIKDWREGALTGQYLVKRLREAVVDLKGYEKSAAPEGWSCHWDSSYKRYFYTDDKTGESQWDYPQVAVMGTTTTTLTTAMAPINVNAAAAPTLWGNSAMVQSAVASYDIMTAPDDHGQIYATNPTVSTYPITTAQTAVSLVVTQDPYRMDDVSSPCVDQDDVRDHADGSDTPPPPGESPPLPPPDQPSVPPPPPPLDDTIAAVPPPPPPLPPPSFVLPSTIESSKADSSQQTAVHAGVAVQSGPVHFSSSQRTLLDYSDLDAMTETGSHSAEGSLTTQVKHSNNSRSSPVPMATATVIKTKKKKSKSSVPLRSTKVKKMSSLVQKWQAIKKQDEVSSEDDSDKEDHAAKAEAQIQQWRKDQIQSGQASNNPNFQEIKGDWRERVRKAKLRSVVNAKSNSPKPLDG